MADRKYVPSELRGGVMFAIEDQPSLASLPSPFHIIDAVLSVVPAGWMKTDDGWMHFDPPDYQELSDAD